VNTTTRTADEAVLVGPAAQRFLSAHDQINNLFLLPRHLMPATDYRAERTRAFEAWHDVCGIKAAA
jgi:putative transposase